MLRSIGAIAFGFVFIAGLSIGGDLVLRHLVPGAFDAAGRAADPAILLVIMAYVALFAIAGCYLTGRLAPHHPMRHALILGALGLVTNVAGSVAMWDTAPAWFHVASILLVMPYAWIGGWLAERSRSRAGAMIPV